MEDPEASNMSVIGYLDDLAVQEMEEEILGSPPVKKVIYVSMKPILIV